MTEKGKLHLVATPIGNMEDISLRALRILSEVDIIAAEDTRQTIKLLNHFKIKKPMTSYHEHNKNEKGAYLIKQLQQGKNIALVSDAGSPGISDPGEDIVRLAIKYEIDVTMIPGPVAAVAGLVLSGLETRRFVFEGFLPTSKKEREKRLLNLKEEIRTIVVYEAPHKIKATLKDLQKALGNRKIVLARELTKKYEEILRCTLGEAVDRYAEQTARGEYVLILEGAKESELIEKERVKWEGLSYREHVDFYMVQGLSKKEAMRKVADDRGVSKRDVYNSLI